MPNLPLLITGFYCQVEEQLNPELKGKPLAVVQYNAWRGEGYDFVKEKLLIYSQNQ